MQRSTARILVIAAVVIIILECIIVFIFQRNKPLLHASLIVTYKSRSITSESPVSSAELVLSDQTDLIDLTIIIPHSPIRQTRYIVSLVTPSSQHISLPGLYPSKKGTSTDDTLKITLDRKYIHELHGDYTLILNEIFSEEPGNVKPGIYLFPFTARLK